MASIFPASCGTQKEWITSPPTSFNRTGTPTGIWISLAVTNSRAIVVGQVSDLPPPLPRCNLDGDGRLLGRRLDVCHHLHRPDDGEQQYQRRDSDTEPQPVQPAFMGFERRPGARRPSRTGTVPDRACQKQPDDHDHDNGDDEQAPGQGHDRRGLVARAAKILQRCGLRAAST